MPYIANTDSDRKEMLEAIGCTSFEDMWKKTEITEPYPEINIPQGRSEFEVSRIAQELAAKNAAGLINFVGGGYYDHLIPAAVGEVTGRSEFCTAYTPYQPEVSQGTLQAIFEYQTAISRLTGMDVSNASLYDGGTALFEAMMLAVRMTKKRRAVVCGAVSPIFRKMIHCYADNLDVELIEIPAGVTDSDQKALLEEIDDKTACVIVQFPNFFGAVEDWTGFVEEVHKKRALAICSVYPTALALLKTPGEMGFDVVTAEAQCLGIPLSFGGPYLGLMATTKKCMRKMPGRIVGETLDRAGKVGYVLTLQTREQHIRRCDAVSNICSNENLCLITALAYMTLLGKEGLRDVAKLCAAKAVFAKDALTQIKGVELVGDYPFFNEFVVEVPVDASEIVQKLVDKGYAAGFPLGTYYKDRKNQILISVTEKRTREEIKGLATAMEAVLWN